MAVLFWIFLDQICPKWIKTWSNCQSKNVTIKSCHIYKKDKYGCFSLNFFGSEWIKIDQIGFLANRSPMLDTHAGHLCRILTASKNWRPILPWYISELSQNVQRLESFLALDQKMILCLSLYIVKYKDKALRVSKDDFMLLIIHCKVQGQSTQGILGLSLYIVK